MLNSLNGTFVLVNIQKVIKALKLSAETFSTNFTTQEFNIDIQNISCPAVQCSLRALYSFAAAALAFFVRTKQKFIFFVKIKSVNQTYARKG